MNLASDHKAAPIVRAFVREGTIKRMTERCLRIIMTGNTVTGQSCSVRHAAWVTHN